MKLLTALLVPVAVVFASTVAIPVVLAVALPLGWLIIWLLPIAIIAVSDKTTGGEKLAWILAIVFLSWFAWIFYFLLAPIKKKRPYDEDERFPSYRRYDRHSDFRRYE